MTNKKPKKDKTSHYITHGVVTENRRAKFNYEILETFEAGLQLKGTEVKALRLGRANVGDAYAGPKDGAFYLLNMSIGPWEGGNRFNHEEKRPRKLLLKKRELDKIAALTQAKGMTVVPLKIYFNNRGYAKVLLGIARGKREFEKRDTEKQREWSREKSRLMKDKG